MTDDLHSELADESGRVWRLKALHMPDDLRPVDITGEGLSIGRSDSNDIVLVSADFPGVSGTHARVVLRDGVVWVEDLGSKNGTFVAGEAIQREAVEHGDVIELGRGGPRFVVLSPTEQEQTVVVPQELVRPKREMGADTVELVREKLGIPAHTKVTDVVKGENRRNTYLLVLVLVVLIAGGIYGVRELQRTGGDLIALRQKIDLQLHAAADEIESHRVAWDQRVSRMQTAYEKANDDNRRALEKERDRLNAELQKRGSAAEDIARQLRQTQARLNMFDPVTMEQTRLKTVNEVGRAVVLIEVAQTFVDASRRQLYVDESGASGFDPNLDKRGKLYVQESTGSGFVFDKDGWILTNAHVVLKKGAQETLTVKDLVLDSNVDIKVVFSGTNRRIDARLMDWVSQGSQDLALLKIPPFPGMPYLRGIDTRKPRPESTTPVYVLGFPLGKRALQPDDSVIASAFRGIVSRGVGDFLQVDAAVHPGNSGGPVINDAGRVIGVVVGMQRINAKEAAAAMGYIIPIDRAGELWPYKPGRRRR